MSYPFVNRRAWHQAHLPSAAIRLVTHYVPLHLTSDDTLKDPETPAVPGTSAYYAQCLGGPLGLAQLYLEAGLLYLEGTASALLSTAYSPLSSIRLPPQSQSVGSGAEGVTAAWKRDREISRRYFQRAHNLHPSLDVPLLPSEGEDVLRESTSDVTLQMPTIEVNPPVEDRVSRTHSRQKRRQKGDVGFFDNSKRSAMEELDNTWYLYLPGLVGAGTALLVVGVVGALSFSSWRKNQG